MQYRHDLTRGVAVNDSVSGHSVTPADHFCGPAVDLQEPAVAAQWPFHIDIFKEGKQSVVPDCRADGAGAAHGAKAGS